MDLVKSKERATSPARSDDGKRAKPTEPIAPETEACSLLLPEKLPTERWIALGVFTISLFYLYLFRRYTSMDPDEGIILQGAQRIVQGQVLYRDFFSYFTPGSYYLLALLFRAFGSSMLVARTALAVYGAFFSVFTYLLARRVCSRWVALAAAYLVTCTCLPWRFMILHNWDSTLWACATVYCAVRLLQAPRWGWALATGSFASLTVLFEQSKGAGLILGLGLGLLLLVLFARSTLRLSRGQWVTLGIGLAWPFALTIAHFATQHGLSAMLADWFWPLYNYSKANSVPFGYMAWSDQTRQRLLGSGNWLVRGIVLFTVIPSFIIPVLPVIAIILLIYWILEAKKGALAKDRAAYYILICSSLAGLLASVLFTRADVLHFTYLIPPLYLVLAWLMDGTDIHGHLFRAIRPLVSLGILIMFTTLGMAFLVKIRSAKTIIDTRRGAVLVESSDAVLEYVQTHVPAGSRVLVYPYLPLYYYLTATFNPTSFDYLQPGMHTPQQEQEAIHQVSADRTAVIVFQPSFNDSIAASWPKTSLASLASDPVADYILSHYHPCRVLASAFKWDWRFVFMVRKDLACPDTLHSDRRLPSGGRP
jgi:4-amino-4-deoxy-L-arabinose transferase-like glycosyltransferase